MPLLFQSLLDDRDPDLYYVRPMKDFTAKEISLYNMFYKLESQVIPTFTTKVWEMKYCTLTTMPTVSERDFKYFSVKM